MADGLYGPDGQLLGGNKTNEQMKILALHHQKINALTAQIIHLGLFTEFLYEQIAMVCDEDGKPLINFDMETFPKWAEERHAQIQQEAQEAMAEQKAAQIKGIDLNG